MTKWDGGKGSTQKPYDKDAFDKNFARIFAKPKKPEKHDFKDAEVRHESFNDLASGRLPNDILFLAEQNEENKAIVEDIRRLNKTLLEELTKQNITLPKEE